MTISTTVIKNSYSGNGSNDTFAYTFKISADADMQVIIRAATGTETVKTLTTHYTVTGAGNASGGNVVFTSGNIPSDTETVVLRRNTTQTQGVDLVENDPFTAESVEGAFDKNLSIAQELQEQVDRSIKLSRTNTMTSTEFTVDATNRANKILAFDSSGEIAVTQELGSYQGNWATATAYSVRDIIKDTSNNNIYICLTAHTSSGSQPISSNTDVAKWALLVDASSATTSQTAAASSATAAASSATASANSATAAATSESNANTHKTAAETAKTAAETAQSAAETAKTAAETALDNFDDTYLGAKSSDPTVDNDGDALNAGDLYFNTTSSVLKYYTGSSWSSIISGITDIVSDTTPQLGGNLDTNSHNIAFDDAHGINDENGNEQIIFQTTSSAVNQIDVTNAATGNGPEISATGGDSNIDLKLTPKGTGKLNLDGIKFPNADGSANQVLSTDGSGVLSFTDVSGGTSWQSSVKTANFTAAAGEGYFINTSGGAFEVDLPSSPSVGDQIEFVDFSRSFADNNLTLDQGSVKFQGNTSPKPVYSTNGQNIKIVYSGSTQGWIPLVDDDVTMETPQSYSVDFLVVAGGGGTSTGNTGGGGAGGYRTSTQTVNGGVTITATVGDGGGSAGSVANGNDSSISGTGLTTITSTGGGAGKSGSNAGGSGGSGGGGGYQGSGGSGNTPSTTPSQGSNGAGGQSGSPYRGGGGGGHSQSGTSGPSGGHGGNGTANSITGSSVTYAGGGGASVEHSSSAGNAGSGGGGAGGNASQDGGNGTANTGGGGGGAYLPRTPGQGGKGVVIISVPTANYSSTTSGSPTVTTSGSNTIIKFTGSGSYTT